MWGGGYPFANMPYYDLGRNANFTLYRVYPQNVGRWHSPDPLAGDITNPQSLNRYAHVLNNPTSLTDPRGWRIRPDVLCRDVCAPSKDIICPCPS